MCCQLRVLRSLPHTHRLLGLIAVSFLRLREVSVEFPIYQAGSRSLKKLLLASSTGGNLGRDAHHRINVRALTDVTLEIGEGERFAIIGRNGAGKTTLLKVLAGIYEPTRGRFTASGKISSLLDVQVGLNLDATGRENIILRGMYMGIHPYEMRERAAEVAEFTELGEYLDMPVRTYSAGMMVRLAFAASTCVPPHILIMDEWLNAGDAQFLEKAQRRVEAFVRTSSILVLASHSLELVKRWCSRGILLQHGRTIAIGPIQEIIAAYREFSEVGAAQDRHPRLDFERLLEPAEAVDGPPAPLGSDDGAP